MIILVFEKFRFYFISKYAESFNHITLIRRRTQMSMRPDTIVVAFYSQHVLGYQSVIVKAIENIIFI